MDFALRVGFDIRLCRPCRPQTQGWVESGVEYVKQNFWPSARFSDLANLDRQAQTWVATVAKVRMYGTTQEGPVDLLAQERPALHALPPPNRLAGFLRELRRAGRDGYVSWEQAWYGVPSPWRPGQEVQVHVPDDRRAIGAGDRRLAIHPRALRRGQRFAHPRREAGFPPGDNRPTPRTHGVQVPTVEVAQRRPLATYDALVGVGRDL